MVFTIKHGHWIIDWWFQPLWKMMEFVSWDDDIPNTWKVIQAMFQTTNQWLYNLLFETTKYDGFLSSIPSVSWPAIWPWAKINRVGKWWSHRTQSIRAAFNRYQGEKWAKCRANFTTFPTWKAMISGHNLKQPSLKASPKGCWRVFAACNWSYVPCNFHLFYLWLGGCS